jgi:hypothetical protein
MPKIYNSSNASYTTANAVSSIYIWSKNVSQSAYEKSEAKMVKYFPC